MGLSPTELKLVAEGKKNNPCRREGGSWHYWKIYQVDTEGDIKRSRDETKQAEWFTLDQIKSLARRTDQTGVSDRHCVAGKRRRQAKAARRAERPGNAGVGQQADLTRIHARPVHARYPARMPGHEHRPDRLPLPELIHQSTNQPIGERAKAVVEKLVDWLIWAAANLILPAAAGILAFTNGGLAQLARALR